MSMVNLVVFLVLQPVGYKEFLLVKTPGSGCVVGGWWELNGNVDNHLVLFTSHVCQEVIFAELLGIKLLPESKLHLRKQIAVSILEHVWEFQKHPLLL